MKDKVLIITSVASMIDQFLYPHLLLLKGMGYDVEVASNFIVGNTCSLDRIEELKTKLTKDSIKYYQVDFYRNVAKVFKNIKAYRQIDDIVNNNQYKFIHCHSPIGGIIGRLVAHKRKIKVLYTAHGFHFYKGAPLINWLIYYPIEKFCSRFTDCLITINHEDYELAKSKFYAKKIEYVPGVGFNTKKYFDIVIDREKKREEIGVPINAKIIFSVGELNKNKNHIVIIKALGKLGNNNIHYVIAGVGNKKEELENLANKLYVNLHILGYRDDIAEICKCSDIFAFPSIREGLGMAALEGMACGLPLICSDNRGSRDYATIKNSIICKANNYLQFVSAIDRLVNNNEMCIMMGQNAIKTAERYSYIYINKIMRDIYNN